MAVILNYTDHMNNLDRVQCICLYVRVWERANAQTLLFYGFCLIFRPNDRVHVVCVCGYALWFVRIQVFPTDN